MATNRQLDVDQARLDLESETIFQQIGMMQRKVCALDKSKMWDSGEQPSKTVHFVLQKLTTYMTFEWYLLVAIRDIYKAGTSISPQAQYTFSLVLRRKQASSAGMNCEERGLRYAFPVPDMV